MSVAVQSTSWREAFDSRLTTIRARYQQLPSFSSLVPARIQEIYKNSRVASWSTPKKVGIGAACVGGSFVFACLLYGRFKRNKKGN